MGSIKNNEIYLINQDQKDIPILLISEYRANPSNLHLEKQIELCKYIKEFCKIKNITPHVALSSSRKDKIKYNFLDEELNFFKKHLTNFNWKNEDSFVTANNSNLIICLSSNMGIETLSRGFKTIFFNLIGDEDQFQVNPYLTKSKPDYFFQNLDEKDIIKKLIYYFNLSNEEWQKGSNFKKNGIIFDEGNTLLKKELKKFLRQMFKKKTAVIIGFGSIGERHANILKKYLKFKNIWILTNRKNISKYNIIKRIQELKNINFDYLIISSNTTKHFNQLKYVENNFKNKKNSCRKTIIS